MIWTNGGGKALRIILLLPTEEVTFELESELRIGQVEKKVDIPKKGRMWRFERALHMWGMKMGYTWFKARMTVDHISANLILSIIEDTLYWASQS